MSRAYDMEGAPDQLTNAELAEMIDVIGRAIFGSAQLPDNHATNAFPVFVSADLLPFGFYGNGDAPIIAPAAPAFPVPVAMAATPAYYPLVPGINQGVVPLAEDSFGDVAQDPQGFSGSGSSLSLEAIFGSPVRSVPSISSELFCASSDDNEDTYSNSSVSSSKRLPIRSCRLRAVPDYYDARSDSSSRVGPIKNSGLRDSSMGGGIKGGSGRKNRKVSESTKKANRESAKRSRDKAKAAAVITQQKLYDETTKNAELRRERDSLLSEKAELMQQVKESPIWGGSSQVATIFRAQQQGGVPELPLNDLRFS